MTQPQIDEFSERLRRCVEAQELADQYSRTLRGRAFAAFGVAAGCLALLWVAWELAVRPPLTAPTNPVSLDNAVTLRDCPPPLP